MLQNIGLSELVLIAVAALVLFGPDKLPEIGRKLGKAVRELRSGTADFLADVTRDPEQRRSGAPPEAAVGGADAGADAGGGPTPAADSVSAAGSAAAAGSMPPSGASPAAAAGSVVAAGSVPPSGASPAAVAGPVAASPQDEPAAASPQAAIAASAKPRRAADPRRLPE